MKSIWMVAALALATAGAASAQDDAETEAPEDKVVCKTEKITGSRTRTQRVCMTQSQWDEVNKATRQKVDDFQRNGTSRRDGQGQAGVGG